MPSGENAIKIRLARNVGQTIRLVLILKEALICIDEAISPEAKIAFQNDPNLFKCYTDTLIKSYMPTNDFEKNYQVLLSFLVKDSIDIKRRLLEVEPQALENAPPPEQPVASPATSLAALQKQITDLQSFVIKHVTTSHNVLEAQVKVLNNEVISQRRLLSMLITQNEQLKAALAAQQASVLAVAQVQPQVFAGLNPDFPEQNFATGEQDLPAQDLPVQDLPVQDFPEQYFAQEQDFQAESAAAQQQALLELEQFLKEQQGMVPDEQPAAKLRRI